MAQSCQKKRTNLRKLFNMKASRHPKDLDFVDFDLKLMTNESRLLSVTEIVNEYQKVEIVDVDASSDDDKDDCPNDDPVSPPSQFEVEDAIETPKKLTLFETDPKFDTLLSQMSVKIHHRRLVNRRQTKIMDFYEKK